MQEIESKRAFSGPSGKSLAKRAIVLKIFCVIGLFYTLTALPYQMYLEPIQFFKIHGWKWVVPLLLTIMRIVGLGGYWMMRQWGVYLFSISFIFGIAYAVIVYKIAPAEIDFFGLTIPLIIVVIGFASLKKMR